MNRLRNDRRGQFVIIAALLIAFLTLSLAVSIHQVNLHRQQLRYKPVRELALGITSDLERALTYALSIQSQAKYKGEEGEGPEFVSNWTQSLIASHSHLGVKMNMSTSEPWPDVRFTLNWDSETGLSQVDAQFDLDIDAYGFKGWVGRSLKYVTLTIFPNSIALSQYRTAINFSIAQGMDQAIPIPNLTPENLIIWGHVTGTTPVRAINVTLSYLGGGNYTVTFSPRINEHTLGIILTVVTPEDDIYVRASHYDPIFVNLRSFEDDNATRDLGLIQLDRVSYPLPVNSLETDPGTYFLNYTPENPSYTFLNWTTEGYITVVNTYSSVTSAIIEGNGTITAFYRIIYLGLDSREENSTNPVNHLGEIVLNSTPYALPQPGVPVSTGSYSIKYDENPSYYFWWWEWSPLENFIFENSSASYTTLTIQGDGTVIAVYGTLPPPTPPSAFVNLRSQEENSPFPTDRGSIELNGVNYTLPVFSLEIKNGTYSLKYSPDEGYDFSNWTTTEDISVVKPYSYLTSVTIKGNGTIIAFYRHCNISLNSKYWANSSFSNLGNITLGTTTYTLPNATVLPRGDYPLKYAPHNESYVFLWWETSTGDLMPWNSTSDATTLTINGDGTVTAVYDIVSEEPPPPPVVGGWDTLYVDHSQPRIIGILVPPYMWSRDIGHLPSHYSTGLDKQELVVTSPTTPTLYLASLVNVTTYIRPNPPNSPMRFVELELGFTYDGQYYKLGYEMFTVDTKNPQEMYKLTIDIRYGNFTQEFGRGVIPEGSKIILTVTVTFIYPPGGSFFLFYGPNKPSCIELS